MDPNAVIIGKLGVEVYGSRKSLRRRRESAIGRKLRK
jgi:hypothetical protein